MKQNKLVGIYLDLKQSLLDAGYHTEIDWAAGVKPCGSATTFFYEYVWVILNSGMKNQVAEKIAQRIYRALEDGKKPSDVFNHKGKARAIEQALEKYEEYFSSYQSCATIDEKLLFLESLPWIGKITKFHLARNLGLDFCKPDRHLVRIARSHNSSPDELCRAISDVTGDRIGVVDVVFWRAANLGMI